MVENLCSPIIWLFEPCYKLVEACVPDAIAAFINSGLPPREFCEFVYLCTGAADKGSKQDPPRIEMF